VPSDNSVIQKSLAAIQSQDYATLESLRDELRPEHVPALSASWSALMPWILKDGYIALLMDETGEAVRPVMADALNSPTVESRAYALLSLSGNFGIFETLLTSGGWLDTAKVDAAVKNFRG
jgi:hypothetical protein